MIELQCSRNCRQRLGCDAIKVTEFEAGVPANAHAREFGDIFAPQAPQAPSDLLRKSDFYRSNALSP
jgi:hypothetical protein